ncbi:dihydroxyacetone kinase family protein [Microlunatus elymi]|uniref:Dihydroxyacetone kinase family protein n=1 Tax=Microlunatus elymi TaxID=2596828 RepID=A0A516PZQ9_9ACTN|nr:dihydroxyacetone kinase family protein [Microlunatus elymi]QDP96660.1 dihydroxyacetone kinase family protein [Microlunatus elymi]
MSFISNDPARFSEQATAGFVAAHSDLIRAVPGGVARRTATPAGQPAIVIGGGSGHYPAFGGLVGPGLAHGAAVGNVFASPSGQQVYDVAKAVENGGGVLLTCGNYAGDVLNFNQAKERLIAEGIRAETLFVTDDISSAKPEESAKRRGIAGGLAVYKIAAAAAEAGKDLDQVVELANRVNDNIRTLGVAFTGCTLPGAHEPLFTVPEGRMGVGVGIHGEPGIDETDLPRSQELAARLWDAVIAERPEGAGDRAVIFVNGLGAVKNEELFILYNDIRALADRDGIEPVAVEVGELVTSFEMAGASLSLWWVDDEIEQLWAAPAYTSGYRKGAVQADQGEVLEDVSESAETEVGEASDASRQAARRIGGLLKTVHETIHSHADELGKLDAIAGDGDHGIGMERGARAAVEAAEAILDREPGAQTLLVQAGQAWAAQAGGTSGVLWGAVLETIGRALGDEDKPDAGRVADGVAQADEQVRKIGGAQAGDKTMVDALIPFAQALTDGVQAGRTLAEAWTEAAALATEQAEATADLMPKMGRARPHAEKSLGTPDPGAISFALIATAVGRKL